MSKNNIIFQKRKSVGRMEQIARTLLHTCPLQRCRTLWRNDLPCQHFPLWGISVTSIFIGSWVHFGPCDSLFPCFNYFLLEHYNVMRSGLFICSKMFICNVIELIFFSVPSTKVRCGILGATQPSPRSLTN